MSTATVPASMGEALRMLESAMEFLADTDAVQMPAEALAECLRALERADAVEAVARGRLLAAFDAKDAHLADGQRTSRTWLVHSLRVTRGQVAQDKAVEALAREHRLLLAGPPEGDVIPKAVALPLAKCSPPIPAHRPRAAE